MILKLNRIAVLFLAASLVSCNQTVKEKTLEDYQFSEKGIIATCEGFDETILSEAIFTFEDDITKFYANENPNLTSAYSSFVRDVIYNRAKFEEIASEHTLKVYDVLASKNNLWLPSGKLNYEHNLLSCITKKMTSKDLKTTLKALIETNSMSLKLFGPAVQSNYSIAVKDKYLAAYIALDFYYGNLSKVAAKSTSEATANKAQ